jgi:hypothetical protein
MPSGFYTFCFQISFWFPVEVRVDSETYRYPLTVNAPQTSKSPCTSIVPLILSLPKILTLSLSHHPY